MNPPRVVIVGAGFGGLEVAKRLKHAPVEVLLVDQHNYHQFQPLLYQVATAGLDAGDISKSTRHIFHGQKNFDFHLATVTGVDWQARHLNVETGQPIPFDYLVLAAGASTAYFGVEGAAEYAFPMKTLDDALRLRSHVLAQFERANRDPSLVEKGALTFVLVGGGPTGVEMAGALVELFDLVLAKDFPRLDVAQARVLLVEMADRLLLSYAEDASAYTKQVLERRGVEVRLQTTVANVTADTVTFKGGKVIPAQTLIWTAGVRAHTLADALGLEQTKAHRVVVEADLRPPGHPNVFVIGDMAGHVDEQGNLDPQVAPVAQQQGAHAAKQIERLLSGQPTEPFHYKDPGEMATIGRNAAVAKFASGRTFRGFFAWFLWVAVHILKLISFRNRLSVLSNWVYNYFTYDRSARLILEDTVPERTLLPEPTRRLEEPVP